MQSMLDRHLRVATNAEPVPPNRQEQALYYCKLIPSVIFTSIMNGLKLIANARPLFLLLWLAPPLLRIHDHRHPVHRLRGLDPNRVNVLPGAHSSRYTRHVR